MFLIDAAPRTVEFITEQNVSWACRGTHPAMNAATENAVHIRDMRILELFGGEIGLHLSLSLGDLQSDAVFRSYRQAADRLGLKSFHWIKAKAAAQVSR
jgi:hypothetical protein